MKKNQKQKKNSGTMMRIMVMQSDQKNWSLSDFYPMQNWSEEDVQLWKKFMLEKMKTGSTITDSVK